MFRMPSCNAVSQLLQVGLLLVAITASAEQTAVDFSGPGAIPGVAIDTIIPLAASAVPTPVSWTYPVPQSISISESILNSKVNDTQAGTRSTIVSALYDTPANAISSVLPPVIRPIVESPLYSFGASGATDGSRPSSLIQGEDGSFYGTTTGGGAYNLPYGQGVGTVFKITSAGIETILYSFTGQVVPRSKDGEYPNKLIQAADGNFLVPPNSVARHRT